MQTHLIFGKITLWTKTFYSLLNLIKQKKVILIVYLHTKTSYITSLGIQRPGHGCILCFISPPFNNRPCIQKKKKLLNSFYFKFDFLRYLNISFSL